MYKENKQFRGEVFIYSLAYICATIIQMTTELFLMAGGDRTACSTK
ncbi:hypothetical protein FDUTEX481_03247 [Tolypothrix sp. PCC 7601]|nr:hypothetical protein FDUTEX481_03247 [Tolypothrix sp. PCC 7601]